MNKRRLIDELGRAVDALESNSAQAVPQHTPDGMAEAVWFVTYEFMVKRGMSPEHSSQKADKAVGYFLRTCRPWVNVSDGEAI